ncbi:hypothetical protein CHUAL_007221 [Chamberlinius hualienensis]
MSAYEMRKKFEKLRFTTRILVTLIGLLDVAAGIKMLKMDVPLNAEVGQTVVMRCLYNMEGTDLYSVKWYKSGAEFFAYLPKDDPKARVYTVPGISVDYEKSDETKVTLKNVQLETSGNFKCEVSGEAPYFPTVFNEREMVVFDLPEDVPKITGIQPKYDIGETLNVNCTSYKSKPAAILSWTVNGDKANKMLLREFPSSTDEDGLETSVLGLEFQVHDHHFRYGEMKLRCTASIAPIYHQISEESIIGGNQQASVLESKETPSQINGCATLNGAWSIIKLLLLPSLIGFLR